MAAGHVSKCSVVFRRYLSNGYNRAGKEPSKGASPLQSKLEDMLTTFNERKVSVPTTFLKNFRICCNCNYLFFSILLFRLCIFALSGSSPVFIVNVISAVEAN